jgi:(1->4)-alpha-D-glucan 1-alpha-D-glucosylmutase
MSGPELRATYRLQLTPEFGFVAARELVPYLRDLGISHLYLSPCLQARSGSRHGYDVVDPTRLSEALGGEPQFRALADTVRDAGMGIVLDVVPNHMAASEENPYWVDESRRSRFFDLDPVSGRWRRFFDIDDLAGVRQEDADVFAETHRLVLSLARAGLIDGLRIDHPDGLADPAGYLTRLHDAGVERVWVEKILDPGEQLRDWPVCGTVGYEFLNDVCALFVDPAGETELTALWEEVSGDPRRFGEVARDAKREQARGTFAPEVERLEHLLPSLDREVLSDAVASLPVYRTYVEPEAGVVSDADRAVVREADLVDEVAAALLLETPAPPEFVIRFQQTTPPVMAKGVEDTAFYRYGRLLALNDVGGDPGRFGITVEQFHAACALRAQRFPFTMLTTQTHDTKRSGDVRARIGALSSMAGEWSGAVRRWLALTEPLRSGGAPDDIERYFIFQTLVGAWPIEPERLTAYMEKALREAKRNTNWVEQDREWEDAVRRFCLELLDSDGFLADFEPFADEVAAVGDRAGLGSLVLKLTAPGIPDIYQGDELPMRALVDPDNRRAVDWDWHDAMLHRLMGGAPPTAETLKLFVTMRLLGLRARRPEPFAAGGYQPLPAPEDMCAFTRGGQVLVVVAVRPVPSGGTVAGVTGRWRDVLTGDERVMGESVSVIEVLGEHGVAVLERE